MSICFLNVPPGISMTVDEITDEQGRKVFNVTFGSKPTADDKSDWPFGELQAECRRLDALTLVDKRAEAVVAASRLNRQQKQDVREEMRVWWNRKLLSLLPAPPWNEERRQFVLGYWSTLDPKSSEEDLIAASNEIAAFAAHSRLAALMRGETTNPPPASPDP